MNRCLVLVRNGEKTSPWVCVFAHTAWSFFMTGYRTAIAPKVKIWSLWQQRLMYGTRKMDYKLGMQRSVQLIKVLYCWFFVLNVKTINVITNVIYHKSVIVCCALLETLCSYWMGKCFYLLTTGHVTHFNG